MNDVPISDQQVAVDAAGPSSRALASVTDVATAPDRVVAFEMLRALNDREAFSLKNEGAGVRVAALASDIRSHNYVNKATGNPNELRLASREFTIHQVFKNEGIVPIYKLTFFVGRVDDVEDLAMSVNVDPIEFVDADAPSSAKPEYNTKFQNPKESLQCASAVVEFIRSRAGVANKDDILVRTHDAGVSSCLIRIGSGDIQSIKGPHVVELLGLASSAPKVKRFQSGVKELAKFHLNFIKTANGLETSFGISVTASDERYLRPNIDLSSGVSVADALESEYRNVARP